MDAIDVARAGHAVGVTVAGVDVLILSFHSHSNAFIDSFTAALNSPLYILKPLTATFLSGA